MTIKEIVEIYAESLQPTREEAKRLKKRIMLALRLIGAIKDKE